MFEEREQLFEQSDRLEGGILRGVQCSKKGDGVLRRWSFGGRCSEKGTSDRQTTAPNDLTEKTRRKSVKTGQKKSRTDVDKLAPTYGMRRYSQVVTATD